MSSTNRVGDTHLCKLRDTSAARSYRRIPLRGPPVISFENAPPQNKNAGGDQNSEDVPGYHFFFRPPTSKLAPGRSNFAPLHELAPGCSFFAAPRGVHRKTQDTNSGNIVVVVVVVVAVGVVNFVTLKTLTSPST